MNNEKKEIGKRIRQVRKELRLNQSQFGARLGVATSSVSAYESGETSPSFDTIAKIASMGNISIDDLVTGGKGSGLSTPSPEAITERREEEHGTVTARKPLENDPVIDHFLSTVDKYRQLFFKDGETAFSQNNRIALNDNELTDEERCLLASFKKLDSPRRRRLIQDAEDMELAMQLVKKKESEKG